MHTRLAAFSMGALKYCIVGAAFHMS